MKAQERLEKLARELYPGLRVDVYRGWCPSAHREGWIARPFGKNEIFLGRNAREAEEYLRQLLDELAGG